MGGGALSTESGTPQKGPTARTHDRAQDRPKDNLI